MILRDLDVELPPAQARVLMTIVSWRGASPPSHREIAAVLGLRSPRGVGDHVARLIEKGVLAPFPHMRKRALVPLVVPTVR